MSATDILRLYPQAHKEIYRQGYRDYLRYQQEVSRGTPKDEAFRKATSGTFTTSGAGFARARA
ncbi:MAG TPA: hypothetical protein VNY04_02855 [Chthoniobacterales bacterium]|jgi:hypothetical protein|nr:hypothetical protein [Chthoniobacterales bacterium]